jgi:bifunctional UDP-N-acetylglucosamine pyrophosphorylase/glucosamine-1-phosphate N-acetyltransferase
MAARPLAVIVLAAGQGKRTRVSTPKVLLPLCGRTMLGTVLDAVAELAPAHTVVVLHHGKAEVEKAISSRQGLTVVDQGAPRGTGHAAQVALFALGNFQGDVLVVYGDCPLVTTDTLRALIAARGDARVAVLTAFPDDPDGLGRILRGERGELLGIKEQRDCTEEELGIEEVNAGLYCFDGKHLGQALASLRDDNAQKELYLTDTVEAFRAEGGAVASHTVEDPAEIQGVNSLYELAIARGLMQERIHLRHLANGVLIEDPSSTFIDWDVKIGRNTRILPCTLIRDGCVIGEGCEVGPFAHLRAQTVLEDGAEIGNFVEAKKTHLGAGTKAKHLSYLGDAVIGQKANIGAGTITANFDGKHKHVTTIEDGAFIGSGTVIVAPSRVGRGATTGAGAILKRNSNVPDGEVWVGMPAKTMKAGTPKAEPVKGDPAKKEDRPR